MGTKLKPITKWYGSYYFSDGEQTYGPFVDHESAKEARSRWIKLLGGEEVVETEREFGPGEMQDSMIKEG